MLCILHGWLLEGSGSNLWTRAVVRSLCKRGTHVHLVCQENHPDIYDFIATATVYERDGTSRVILSRDTAFPGKCHLHKPVLGETLPVFVWDKYEEYSRVVPMVHLSAPELRDYIDCNVAVVSRVIRENGISIIHANHAVLMPTIAAKAAHEAKIPFTIMPHGSAIEYAVTRDDRFLAYANDALSKAAKVFVIGDEMRARVLSVFPNVPDLESRLTPLHLGVDTAEFEPVARQERPRKIAELLEAIAPLPRGRSQKQERALLAALPGIRSREELSLVLRRASKFLAKRPDQNLDARLASVPWTTAPTLLFVGRLIAWKGIQSLIASLPIALDSNPHLRTIIVGHGPLREAMEALVWALQQGRRDIVDLIVHNGSALEGNEALGAENPLVELATFYDKLEQDGLADEYFQLARERLTFGNVIFTGYLTHHELRHLFPCCDVGIFPSVVKEAGPLVFLEALASGCFPMGTYFGGLAASIDAVSDAVSPEVADVMKLDPEATVRDLAEKIPLALAIAPHFRETLSRLARERYDWSSVTKLFLGELRKTQGKATSPSEYVSLTAGLGMSATKENARQL